MLAAVAALVLGLDAGSKALVVASLTPGEPVHVIGDILQWNLLRNPGAAFSVGTSYTAVFTLLAIGVVVFVVRTARRLRSAAYAVAFGLLLGGATGNLADRLVRAPGAFHGDVVDWIEVTRYYPVFNLADSAICIAAVLFVILALRGIRMDGIRAADAAPGPAAPDSAAPDSAEATESTPPSGGATPRTPRGGPAASPESTSSPESTPAEAER